MTEGLQTRIHKSSNRPIILDHITYRKQKKIQESLEKEIPHMKNIIYSEPAISDYKWRVCDYIDLYYEHYIIVIHKINKATANGE